MTILTGVKITAEQKQFLDEKAINFSKFVRNAIDREMKKCNPLLKKVHLP